MKHLELSNLLPRFFSEHLGQQRNLSRQTIAAYRDTFRLLLRYLQRTGKTTPAQLPLDALNAAAVLEFLAHLEQQRKNCVRTRNLRLAAIRSFLHYLSDLLGPDLPAASRHILNIPSKRFTRPLLGYLTRDEVQSLLSCCDGSWTGRRDHLLWLLLYNSGARVSEIIALRVRDVVATDFHNLPLHGKGRKERMVPLWRNTQRLLRHWVKEQQLTADAPVLPNRFGQPMTRSGVAWQLRRLLCKASAKTPALRNRQISPHTFRHTTAMHLLQSDIEPAVIALWLGHENLSTTHQYVEADLEMKRRTLAALTPPKTHRPAAAENDWLVSFLNGL
jgi:integrase/recombinase XerD